MGTSEKNSIFGEIYLFRDFLRQSLLPALFIPAPRSPLQAHVLATSTTEPLLSPYILGDLDYSPRLLHKDAFKYLKQGFNSKKII
jgi:hypothetical protein